MAGRQESTPKEWGYDLYPGRKGEKPTWYQTMFGFNSSISKMICQRNLRKVIKESPLVKLMLAALHSSGCPVDIERHICCETCTSVVSGGYDVKENQVVICDNISGNKAKLEMVLTHELVHMFDYCRNKFDVDNLEHLACTEIRAANLAGCNWFEAMTTGVISPFALGQAHQKCIEDMATRSVAIARGIPKEEAAAIVTKVFGRCYPDLEPVGRWMSWTREDKTRACLDGGLYGYDCRL